MEFSLMLRYTFLPPSLPPSPPPSLPPSLSLLPSLPPSLSLPLPPSLLQLPVVGVQLKGVLIVMVLGISLLNMLQAFFIILTSGVGKNGTTIAVRTRDRGREERRDG